MENCGLGIMGNAPHLKKNTSSVYRTKTFHDRCERYKNPTNYMCLTYFNLWL